VQQYNLCKSKSCFFSHKTRGKKREKNASTVFAQGKNSKERKDEKKEVIVIMIGCGPQQRK